MIKPAIEAKELTKQFGSVQALSGLSFSVARGEIYGLIGPDGAGKTTAMRALIGAIVPDSGKALVAGLDVAEAADRIRSLVGYMPQLYGLYQELTVTENMRFFARIQGVPREKFAARLAELLGFVRLNEFSDRRAGALSGGMYKKLAIACALVHSPAILILDEPTNGVDPVSRRELWSLLFELAGEGVSVLVSTPYMDEAERCHRVALTFRGRIVREGSPDELLAPLRGRLFALSPGEKSFPPATAAILREGVTELTTAYSFGSRIHIITREKTSVAALTRVVEKIIDGPRNGRRLRAGEPGFEDVFMELQALERTERKEGDKDAGN